ncbi:Rho1 guanine nucleotide exchange factor 1 [Dothidotthia symphoricarpi CBS 119687]|uniref:Rho1 guanine nucleotide exchange factor 1 n=1 Tax=Dothidotthia symphoricarpi CBS 119687 TaxID=1392245 RepID=A0A6A5ZY87_9PLEO|nr:Rho1 guanine nucleotide exchange factor 1 [Dothidotthia symphoricarpi CBS 119687]KAF2124256.1 Rho1 guanine nucleotide exchange factor 1 [Dothidotthia symphoricarpi CBS 119687]
MADYGNQQGREFARPPNYGQPTGGGGGASGGGARDAAFANIFGASPAMAGRSQTMTSQSQMRMPDRAATMSSQTADMMQRAPPIRQPVNGHERRPHPNYEQRAVSNYEQQRPPSQDPQQNNYGRPSPNGYPPPNPRYSEASGQPQRQPQPQYLPTPLRPERQPYGQPQRFDPRLPQPGQPQFNKPIPPRFPGPPGAMNADPYRSQSLASGPRPQFVPPGQNYQSPANTFRQQPYMNHMARTTAQGRVVPERPDERTMSMTSYARDSEFAQTMSGRVIPNRRRESDGPEQPFLDPRASAAPQLSVNIGPGARTRNASQGSISSQQPRTMSMASTVVSPSERTDTMSSSTTRPSSTATVSSNNRTSGQSQGGQQIIVAQRRAPLVYPALLSKVAEVFMERVNLSEKEKDGLVYKSAFTGADAVDLISYIIKTTDRNLALLLGRSLDAQKFFHDVTYAHRLRDSTNEVYQFRETIMEEQAEVNGVFTLLTECYSPTCTRDRLCYSIACPRRLEQQARLNLRIQPGLKKEDSRASLHEDADDEEQKLWINTVPKEVAATVSEQEKKRQEVISELMYTERDFVKDLEYLRDFWMKPLRNPATSPIPEHRREKFVRTVFSNCQEVYMVNSRLAEALTRRQQREHVVRNVGDIFLEYVPHFTPFIKYGANQLFGKYEFEHEKRTNSAFMKFVDEVERMKESRKLELNGYLTKPTTRLARYPLLLENIVKFTADDNPDKEDIPKVIKIIKETLSKVNAESGKAENHFNLMQLNKDLKFKPGEYVDLKLTDENRQLVFKGSLKKTPTEVTGDITCYLFDHAVLLVRAKVVNKREEQKVYKKPIPLELLVITQMEEIIPNKLGISKRPSTNLMGAKSIVAATPKYDANKLQGHPITFKHLGKGGYELTLYASTPISQQKWMEHIESQQRSLRERSNIFTKTILNEGFFTPAMRVTCCVPLDGGRKLALGTDAGVFVVERKPKDSSMKPRRVLDCKGVTQLDVLEQHQIVLVLADKTLFSYSTEALDPDDNNATAKRPRKICHANFFKAGICVGNQLVAAVKTSALSTTIKVYEPKENMANKARKSGFAKMLTQGQDQLKPYKEFYIPTESTSIHFLRSKLCVGCARGFEVVSLETLETQSLLDQADTSLDFVVRKENIKPIHIERMASEFLLCYTDYSFFVNRNGWRAKQDWKITWEGNPQAFAIFNPYILAFEPSFIEIRHMESGGLVHIITAKNIRWLHTSTREILYSYEDEMGTDVIASLDFWQTANGAKPSLEQTRLYEKS